MGTPPNQKKFRANFKLASLNMKGRTSLVTGPGPISKWSAVSRDMRERKIGLLALQETHLSEPLQEQVTTLYQCRLSVFNSALQENPTASAGVAFVINKELLRAEDVRFHSLIPGHAIFISFQWQPGSILSLINVYAHQTPTFLVLPHGPMGKPPSSSP